MDTSPENELKKRIILAKLLAVKRLGNGSRLTGLLEERGNDPFRLYQDISSEKIKGLSLDKAKAAEIESGIRKFLANNKNFILARDDETYPALLKQIPKGMPHLLFGCGSIAEDLNNAVAIVGTRKPSQKGLSFAYNLSASLSKMGFAIVSGGAFGIDAAAHKGALSAEGITWVVLGTGHNFTYPSEHRELFEQICKRKGAAVSELLPMQRGARSTFGARNRIIAGIARATIVVEGGLESGALITAREAAKFGRVVLAVPGDSGDPLAEGPNMLISAGAIPCASIDSVINALESPEASGSLLLPLVKKSQKSLFKENQRKSEKELKKISTDSLEKLLEGLSLNEKAVFLALSSKPMYLDDISEKIGLEVFEVTAVLTILEIKGLAKKLSGMLYVNPYFDE
ncbi:MAG: DNA-processing protein DprA [Phycisphaerae bacterium]|nr:DNA-processing protein DprA [Phycisphaerae bacterium]